jgi:FAD/FMN-containing dehydrogenase
MVDPAPARDWLAEVWESVHPYGTGGAYVNFPDPELADAERAYHGQNLERLLRVKEAYDPDRVFRFPQSLSLAGPR